METQKALTLMDLSQLIKSRYPTALGKTELRKRDHNNTPYTDPTDIFLIFSSFSLKGLAVMIAS